LGTGQIEMGLCRIAAASPCIRRMKITLILRPLRLDFRAYLLFPLMMYYVVVSGLDKKVTSPSMRVSSNWIGDLCSVSRVAATA
jgi:hypothetical protein